MTVTQTSVYDEYPVSTETIDHVLLEVKSRSRSNSFGFCFSSKLFFLSLLHLSFTFFSEIVDCYISEN